MRNTGLMVDALHAQLLELAKRPKYCFEMLKCDWGRTGGVEFSRLQSMFCRGMRELAKDCPVRSYEGGYYLFNGKFYERVPVDVIESGYQLLMEDLQIAPMMNRTSLRKDVFLKVIEQYNYLVPHFDIVAFNNGIVDFGSGLKEPRVMPFSPEYHVLYYHPYDFDVKAKCPRWLNFLHEVLPDRTSRLILQMFLGLGLIQRGEAYNPYEGKMSSKVELCLLLIGRGANGKSVIFDVACQLFGRDRISKMDYADLTADGDEGMRGRLPLRNAIFNWSSDSDYKSFGRKNTGMFKRLVSGEPVPMRELGRNILEENTIPYLIFNLNELPFPEDASLGFIRRLQYVSFDVTIPKDRQNHELANQIISHELSGVFNWVFRGMLELKKRRYQFPAAAASKKQKLKSLLQNHPVSAWLLAYDIRSDRFEKGNPGIWVYGSTLYSAFLRFCKDNDMEDSAIPTNQRFGRMMWNKEGFRRKRTSGGIMYQLFGVNEGQIDEPILIDAMDGGDCDETEPESFIKDDD